MALEPTLGSLLGLILHPAKVTEPLVAAAGADAPHEDQDGPFPRQTRVHSNLGPGRPCPLRVLICKCMAPVLLYLIFKWCVARSWCSAAASGAPMTFGFAWFMGLAQTPSVSSVAGWAGGRSSRSCG